MECQNNHADEIWKARLQEMHRLHTREKVELLEALKAHFGDGIAEVVAKTARRRAFRQWRTIAEQVPSHGLEDLLSLLWEPLRSRGFVFQAEPSGEGIQMTCTRCPIADLAQTADDRQWLFHLACGVDAAIAEGFNPRIGFRRTRTLMEGHACCDHFYYMKRAEEGTPGSRRAEPANYP